MKDFMKKASQTTKGSNLNNLSSINEEDLGQKHKKWKSNSISKSSIWE